MHRIKLISIVFILAFASILAQEKLFTVEDVVMNSYSKLVPERLYSLNWIPGTEKYYWIEYGEEFGGILTGAVESEGVDTLLTLTKLNETLTKNDFEAMRVFPRITWTDSASFVFKSGKILFKYNLTNDELSVLNVFEEKLANYTPAPNHIAAAYTKENNLFVAVEPEDVRQITNDEEKGIVNGQAVSRQEFGITGGIFWSPKSNYVAFYRKDETKVSDYPLVEMGTTPATLKLIKYPMNGQASEHVTIGIYSIEKNETLWLNTEGPYDQYLTTVTWGPEEKFIYVSHLNRDQNHLKLVKYDAATGEAVKTLFEEKDDKYVEPENPLHFLPDNPNKFLWFSERDKWNHLYLYDTDGNLIKQVTKGDWVVLSFEGFDENGENIFITATKDSPIDVNFYRVNLESGEMTRITKTSGRHMVVFTNDGKYFLDSYSNTETPFKVLLLDKNGDELRTIHNAANPIADYKIGETKIFTIEGKGYDYYCRMVLPPDFDPSKKYPVIVYVYGGPHAQLVTNSWPRGRYAFWFLMMAQKGYIVFTLDNRGSDNRGLEFEQETFRHLGTREIEDQLLGIEYLKKQPFVDSTRFGVFGWSYGGFMTTSLMLRTNDTFKVGVGGGAVIDWKFYEVMYGERYMDTEETNPEGFKEASLLNYVDNLNGKLLLVHGTSDPTVVWQHTLEFVKKATNLNKPLDYYPYVGHPHGVGGIDAVNLYTKITNYFWENL